MRCYWVLAVSKNQRKLLADIIAVNENPLLTISTLEKVIFVMKDGKIYKTRSITIYRTVAQ
jgi:hypothetical protein